MKKFISVLTAAVILTLSLFGCAINTEQSDKLKIVASLFPAYDFARNIALDNAQVTLLLPPGVETHSYEPTPKDMVEIQNCDIFIYNGGESESWIDGILDSLDSTKFKTVKLIDCTDALLEEDESYDNDEQEHGHEHDGDEVGYDEHIWTSPAICIELCNAIESAISSADSGNAAQYRKNLKSYTAKLSQLDKSFKDVVDNSARQEIIFGDRFPFKYFAQHYGLTYHAAFPGCSSQTEPSAATMARLITETKEDKIPAVFYIEMSNHAVADAICKETGAKALLFHSCHNLTRDETNAGETYLSLMNKNLKNLKIALN
ncbi:MULTISPECIES: metal ABC transporter substrate-binding protein [unclassified Ruminococcus]|uniref:metal ABC transporter substrate-binding protein n=1 Tax=unclassified Ruminococcus TaxID=2608920 RepID=UPI0021086BB5|nr:MULTISPECIES: metal ABC transporter substrate-binding protein [unclassified Ruminococcus]MCQ4022944.1 zinc ABC transporter substrate-binding protein [Ruminococcus sp. zg-924]MCQ4115358.1 zinc ABC transporter substrate-binding protein [Ruminococcus sp. zg-921]